MVPARDNAAQDHHALGLALRRLRDNAGLTQEELAARVGIGATYISQVENGHRGVRWHSVTRMLSALGSDLHELADVLAETELKRPS